MNTEIVLLIKMRSASFAANFNFNQKAEDIVPLLFCFRDLNVRSPLWYTYKNWREVNVLYTARCSDRSLIHSLTASKLTNKSAYRCPDCDQPVLLKTGSKVRPHFAHIRSCRASGESRWHRAAKTKLFELFSDQQLFVALEYYLPSAGRRADVYVASAGKTYVFECQSSAISQKEMTERKLDYERAGAELIWILMPENVKTGVQRQAVSVVKRGALCHAASFHYWTLCPQTGQLFCYGGCASISRARWTVDVTSFRIYNQSPEWFLMTRATTDNGEFNRALRSSWSKNAISHRMTRFKQTDPPAVLLRELMAVFQLPPHAYPALARVPFPGSGALSIPPEVWQSLLHVKLLRNEGVSVRLTGACELILLKCHSFLQPMDRFHIRSIVLVYFSYLADWGVLTQRYPGVFTVKHPITFNKTTEQLFMDDSYVAQQSSFVYKNN